MRIAAMLFFLSIACGRIGFGPSPNEEPDGGADASGNELTACDGVAFVADFFVDPSGDNANEGSQEAPWQTIQFAVRNAPDGSVVVVAPGIYAETVDLDRAFSIGLTLRAEVRYRSRIEAPLGQGVFCTECTNVVIEGFEITQGPSATNPLIHITGAGSGEGVVLRNNILHDSPDNSLFRVSGGGFGATLEWNIIYNAGRGAMIHLADSRDMVVRHNVVFNDFEATGFTPLAPAIAVVWIEGEQAPRANHEIVGNIVLRWRGAVDGSFVRIEEADGVVLESNLFVGDATDAMQAAIEITGAGEALIRNNTVVGDLPSEAFAFSIRATENAGGASATIVNNIFSDPTATMGDLADGLSEDINAFVLDNNLYWNGGDAIPSENGDFVTVEDDSAAVLADPGLPSTSAASPVFVPSSFQFTGGFGTNCEVFDNLASSHGEITVASPAFGAASDNLAAIDLLGRPRTTRSVGALEPK